MRVEDIYRENCDRHNNNNNNNQPVRIGANCILEVEDDFFLIVQILATTNSSTIVDTIVVIELSSQQARDLFDAGVRRCRVLNAQTLGATENNGRRDVDFKCVFIADGKAFLVFIVENGADEIAVVRAPLCTVIED